VQSGRCLLRHCLRVLAQLQLQQQLHLGVLVLVLVPGRSC
jgi:hypothetical protein